MTDQKYKLVPVEPTEEETLRAVTAERDELREQLKKYQAALAGHDRRLVRQEKIAAELRRKLEAERDALQARIAQLEQSALTGYEDGWHALRNERDALKNDLEQDRRTLMETEFERDALKDVLADRDMDREMAARSKLELIEANRQLDALRARIEGAPTIIASNDGYGETRVSRDWTLPKNWIGKRVALVALGDDE